MSSRVIEGDEDLSVFFLAQGEQAGQEVAQHLVNFISQARSTLDMALYDFRLNDELRAIIVNALRERANAGVNIRIAYDADKPPDPNMAGGQDPAPAGTGSFVQSLGYPFQRIGGLKLMHNKYVIRDNEAVWTGSTNWTTDSWTLQDNNVVQIFSSDLAAYYVHDFTQLWSTGTIGNSGSFDTRSVNLIYGGGLAQVHVLFSPGRGPAIDYEVAQRVAQAKRRVRVCSMLLNSGALLAALNDLLRTGQAQVDGVYDRTQMESVLYQWQAVPHNHWKIGAVQDIIEGAKLVGKNSTPYSPDTPHDFMHNKVIVVDNTVITGSYNFSHSAELNAENILIIENLALANQYSRYIDHLKTKYGSRG